ncbi:hypothetical protein OAN22_01200 [Alphaproteobacteria bacterium]|nr:hypothetical protein [Alphaproteobacteria bacterium]
MKLYIALSVLSILTATVQAATTNLNFDDLRAAYAQRSDNMTEARKGILTALKAAPAAAATPGPHCFYSAWHTSTSPAKKDESHVRILGFTGAFFSWLWTNPEQRQFSSQDIEEAWNIFFSASKNAKTVAHKAIGENGMRAEWTRNPFAQLPPNSTRNTAWKKALHTKISLACAYVQRLYGDVPLKNAFDCAVYCETIWSLLTFLKRDQQSLQQEHRKSLQRCSKERIEAMLLIAPQSHEEMRMRIMVIGAAYADLDPSTNLASRATAIALGAEDPQDGMGPKVFLNNQTTLTDLNLETIVGGMDSLHLADAHTIAKKRGDLSGNGTLRLTGYPAHLTSALEKTEGEAVARAFYAKHFLRNGDEDAQQEALKYYARNFSDLEEKKEVAESAKEFQEFVMNYDPPKVTSRKIRTGPATMKDVSSQPVTAHEETTPSPKTVWKEARRAQNSTVADKDEDYTLSYTPGSGSRVHFLVCDENGHKVVGFTEHLEHRDIERQVQNRYDELLSFGLGLENQQREAYST